MKKYFLTVLTGILFLAGATLFTACGSGSPEKSAGGKAAHAAKYHCPMHPTYVSDRAGDCPICGMRLVPIESEESHDEDVQAKSASKEKKLLYYRNPMDPKVTSPVPMKDQMGMDYVPVYEEERTEQFMGSSVEGLAPVRFPAEREQLIGVKTSFVVRREMSKGVRASGRIAYDPDLYGAVVEYREALKSREKVKNSPWPDVRERTEGLIAASVLRLRQMGLSDQQIHRLGRAEQDPTNLLLSSKGGSVWVYAQIFEYEAGLVKTGQTMEVTGAAFPGKTFRGKVVAVDTVLSPETRTLRVRGEVPAEGLLKPEMYVDVIINIPLGRRLMVPEEAVMNTGKRKISFVRNGPGRFEPREVVVGQEAENSVEILSGLTEGEAVVTSANFLIDSESKLKAALSKTTPKSLKSTSEAPLPPPLPLAREGNR
jgi:Cu(I)/Ag(I) efflux system membrane fusion protein